jgi:hypothetical protein
VIVIAVGVLQIVLAVPVAVQLFDLPTDLSLALGAEPPAKR